MENRHSEKNVPYPTDDILDSLIDAHAHVVQTISGKPATRMMMATSVHLQVAYYRARRNASEGAFVALSAETGSGKTLGACSLMLYLARRGEPVAYVAPTLAVAEAMLKDLLRLAPDFGLDGEVAAFTSLHKVGANPGQLRDYAAQGVVPSAQYSEDQFKQALIAVTTHNRWARELTTGEDLGVLLQGHRERSLVIVDEEPELTKSVVRNPGDVSALIDFLTDTRRDEAGRLGFTAECVDTLQAIHARMRLLKDTHATGANLRATPDLITQEELRSLSPITSGTMLVKAQASSGVDADDVWAFHYGTVEFLRLSAAGRVFYSRSTDRGSFYAYGYKVEPKPRHVILDGTADLNGLYAIGQHVSVLTSVRADYADVKLHAVDPPKSLRGQMRSTGTLKSGKAVDEYLQWFMPFLVSRTHVGQEVLVYCKKVFLAYDRHTLPEFDSSGKHSQYRTEYQGRVIHWATFGMGRGLNGWNQCTAYFRLGDFMLARAASMAKVAATTGHLFSADEIADLNRSRDARLWEADEAHLAVSNKQDSARICIRNIDNDCKAQKADLYMVDCDLVTLVKYRERMYPGSAPYAHITCADDGATTEAESEADERQASAARVASLFLRTDAKRLTLADIAANANVRPDNLGRTLRTVAVQRALKATDWRDTTLKALGLPGKGRVFVRSNI
jgi:hypothetical protein